MQQFPFLNLFGSWGLRTSHVIWLILNYHTMNAGKGHLWYYVWRGGDIYDIINAEEGIYDTMNSIEGVFLILWMQRRGYLWYFECNEGAFMILWMQGSGYLWYYVWRVGDIYDTMKSGEWVFTVL